MIVELIDDFFAENPAAAGSDKVDTSEADEVIDAIAKTVPVSRIAATSAVASHAKH
jgi:hypothetical protein